VPRIYESDKSVTINSLMKISYFTCTNSLLLSGVAWSESVERAVGEVSEDVVQVGQREFVSGKADKALAIQINAQRPKAGDARVQPQIEFVAADQHWVGHVPLHHGA
jgi:hypothetical protein